MQLPYRQRGAGWLGKLYVLTTLGALLFLGLALFPVYMNELKVRRAVTQVASELSPVDAETDRPRSLLQKRWDLEDITEPTVKDIKIKSTERGKVLSYDYTAQVPLMANAYLSINFMLEKPIGGGD